MLFNNNKTFISLRCPMYDGCHTLHQFKVFNQWLECPHKTPFKLRCRGMRGICMAMGILVYISSNGWGEIFVNGIVAQDGREISKIRRTPSKNIFEIDSKELNQVYQPDLF